MRRSRDDIGANGYGMPVFADTLGGHIGGQTKFLQAGGAEILAVEADLLVLVGGKPQHLERNMLEGAQQFATVLQHQRAVGAGELDQDVRALPLAIGAYLRVHGDLVAQAEVTRGDDRVQQFADLLGGGDFVLNRHG